MGTTRGDVLDLAMLYSEVDIKRRLEALQIAFRMSEESLAVLFPVHPGTIATWKRGRGRPNLIRIRELEDLVARMKSEAPLGDIMRREKWKEGIL